MSTIEHTDTSRHDLPTPMGASLFATALAVTSAVAFMIADGIDSLYAGVWIAAGYGALLIAVMAAVTGLISWVASAATSLVDDDADEAATIVH
ncbi:hypothetical protein [Nocardioides pakistanensis]